jgi:serpin B
VRLSRADFVGQARRLPSRKVAGGAPALQLIWGLIALIPIVASADFDLATKATNEFGLDLYSQLTKGDENLCLSPYSISCALAMTLSGADGETRSEMARVLHLDANADVDQSFAALQKSLEEMGEKTAKIAKESKENGGPSEPITIAIANRLFPQSGYEFRKELFARLKQDYGAPPEPLDYKKNAGAATKRINDWVAKQTRDRIRDLIPQTLDPSTRLVLANAIYLKAPWQSEFRETGTKSEPFHVNGGAGVPVPTMSGLKSVGYEKQAGYTTVAIPYIGNELQFVIYLPDRADGLRSLERELNADILVKSAKLSVAEVNLHLPKFKLEPPTVPLSAQLKTLGMKSAFDIPLGSANFDRMAARKPNEYLAISEVFHKTFIAVDEKGTEAAAATAITMLAYSAITGAKPTPIEVRVDRPFLYAIQHVPSGACLFIGRVTDPR